MASRVLVRRNQYYDSVFLMGINKHLSSIPGVQQAAVLMGSEANKAVFSELGVQDAQLQSAQANDLVVAVVAKSQQLADEAIGKLDEFLLGGVQPSKTQNPHSFEEGLQQRPDSNIAVISIPGEYAAREAHKALDAGLNVFLFSDHVTVEEELNLKQTAAEKKLLVMGPGCGTSIINGIGLGFANVVRKGSIGVIAGAGTGLQEFTSQVHNAGLGISQAIGTGGRDLSDQIGGLTTFSALDTLEADSETKIIAIISKPAGKQTLAKLVERVKRCSKPVVGCFLGSQTDEVDGQKTYDHVTTIDEALNSVVALSQGKKPNNQKLTTADSTQESALWNPEQKYLRGIFAGGTFCYQSQQILQSEGIEVYSNAPLDPKRKLPDSNRSQKHSLVDLGEDEFTVGRPHPMIDGAQRKQRILAESFDPEVAILMLDIILGFNASRDPAGELVDAIQIARQSVSQRGGYLTAVASICGTEGDPQDIHQQIDQLHQAGALVFRSNAAAASFCAAVLKGSGRK
jgi:FdrA protein